MSLLERVYFLHRQLIENRYPNSRTLMEEFEISQPTARRDIAYLRDRLLAPIGFDQQQNGFYYTETGFDLPFANSPRIVFLLGMLNRLAEETGLSGLPEIRQLENRLSAMVGRDQAHISDSIHCEWVEVEHPDARIFDTIIEAIVKRRQLCIEYRSPAKQNTSRTVEPLKLINYQGRWYLSAWCLLRGAHRTFHLARITAAELAAKIAASSDHTGQDLDRSFGIFKGPPRYTAHIRFTGTAAELVRNQTWHKDQRMNEQETGIVLHIPVHDDREIIMKILQYGSMAEVIGPPALRERLGEELQSMNEIYSAGK
ncbi:MAG: transcriptional regulator [Desulfofustis sp.]|jgi:predicted DNA-binding transcriptional regulator YafY|nr:transcriptional regulator [Desulfofustis sp.]